MVLNEIEALIRVIALAIAGDSEKAEEIVKWAYGDEQKKKEKTGRRWLERSYKDFLRTDIQNISLRAKREFIRRYIDGKEFFPSDEVKSIISQMDYSDFLRTPYWKAIALYVKERDGKRCSICGATKTLQVHHLTYNNHGDELHHIEDLICVCEKCHEKLHSKKFRPTKENDLSNFEENRIMGRAERDLLSLILIDGKTELEFSSDSEFYADSEDERRTVFDFISQALEEDNAHFSNPVYKATYDAYADDYYDGYAQDEIVKHLLDGPDRNIAYVVSQLSTTEVYEPTIKNLRKWLTKFVPKAILVFQICRLEDKNYSLRKQLYQAQAAADSDRAQEILQEMIKGRKAHQAVRARLNRFEK